MNFREASHYNFRTFFFACISIHWYDLHTEKHLPLVLLILGLPSSFLLCFNCFINQRLLPDNNIDYYAIGGWGMSVHGAATVIQLLPSSYSLASSLRTYNESWCTRELITLIDFIFGAVIFTAMTMLLPLILIKQYQSNFNWLSTSFNPYMGHI